MKCYSKDSLQTDVVTVHKVMQHQC